MAARPHPSGRPVRKSQKREPSIWRIPDDGYVTPRLRHRTTDAIGFTHDFSEQKSSSHEEE